MIGHGLRILLFASLLLLVRCSHTPNPVVAGGSGTESTNGVYARAVLPDKRPVVNAAVKMRTKNYLADTAAALAKMRRLKADVTTDSSGRFAIEKVDIGEYFIEINHRDNHAALLDVRIVHDSQRIDFKTVVLQPAAKMHGTIDRSHIPDSVPVYVSLYGMERTVTADTSGKFNFKGLPSGRYRAHVAADRHHRHGFDTDTFELPSGADTSIGELPNPVGYSLDSLVVRAILDANGRDSIPVYRLARRSADNRIDSLDLSGLYLRILPDTIGALTALTSLKLSRNVLSALPQGLTRCTKLRRLEISRNSFDSIPAVVWQLEKLTHLICNDNRITAIPAGLTGCEALQELRLGRNLLSALPDEIGAMTRLRILGLGGNRITQLNARIGLCTSLQKLELDANDLTALPAEIGKLTALASLDAPKNRLQSLPAEIAKCSQLKALVLQGNELGGLPEEIVNLTGLRYLGIEGNRLCDVGETLESWINRYAPEHWEKAQQCNGSSKHTVKPYDSDRHEKRNPR